MNECKTLVVVNIFEKNIHIQEESDHSQVPFFPTHSPGASQKPFRRRACRGPLAHSDRRPPALSPHASPPAARWCMAQARAPRMVQTASLPGCLHLPHHRPHPPHRPRLSLPATQTPRSAQPTEASAPHCWWKWKWRCCCYQLFHKWAVPVQFFGHVQINVKKNIKCG